MPEEHKSREDLEYTNEPSGNARKCSACDNYKHQYHACKLMDPKDAKVEENGWCEEFKPGKQLLWDYYLQEERRKKLIKQAAEKK